MIAVDTNILVYSHRADATFHREADLQLSRLAEGGQAWAVPWPCLHEFLAIVTHPKIYNPPTPLDDAMAQIGCWLESPSLQLIGELAGYWDVLKSHLASTRLVGPRIHDLRIAAVCLQNDVKVLWSADRDFTRIKELKVQNPLVP